MTFLADLQLVTLPPDAEALRADVRAFLSENLAGWGADRRARSWMASDVAFSRALARRAWVGMTLPPEYGGGGRDHFARFVVAEELLGAGAPVAAHWIADRQSGPLIARFGSVEQKEFYLPRICSAEAFFCIGMSEPDTGSDLAGIRTRAVHEDAGWRLNGTKLWTTHAQTSHYMIALVRTSGDAEDRKQGLSQFIVDLSLPGVEIRPIVDLTGASHFSEVRLDDVLLSPDSLIGEEGGGWAQVNAELALERSGPERLYSSIALLDAWVEHLRTRNPDRIDRDLLGRLVGRLAVLRSMSLAVTARLVAGESPATAAALVKDLGTTLEQLVPSLILDAVGQEAANDPDTVLMRALLFTLQISPSYSLRGGTREILRGMIARGLGLR